MAIDLEKLTQRVLASAGEEQRDLLGRILQAIKLRKTADLATVEELLPDLAPLLHDPDENGCGEITLEIFRYLQINQSTVDRLVTLHRSQPSPLIVKAFGMSNPDYWNQDGYLMLAEALALEHTTSAAAQVLFKNSLSIDISLTISSLENLALNEQLQVRSDAVSKLISHTEGKHGAMACQCIKNILLNVDGALRCEIAAKLAWSHRRGLTLLQITATDEHPNVRLASAKALWRGYRIRGRQLLAVLSQDIDPKIRTVAVRALS